MRVTGRVSGSGDKTGGGRDETGWGDETVIGKGGQCGGGFAEVE